MKFKRNKDAELCIYNEEISQPFTLTSQTLIETLIQMWIMLKSFEIKSSEIARS